jgi:hypothetical protein
VVHDLGHVMVLPSSSWKSLTMFFLAISLLISRVDQVFWAIYLPISRVTGAFEWVHKMER